MNKKSLIVNSPYNVNVKIFNQNFYLMYYVLLWMKKCNIAFKNPHPILRQNAAHQWHVVSLEENEGSCLVGICSFTNKKKTLSAFPEWIEPDNHWNNVTGVTEGNHILDHSHRKLISDTCQLVRINCLENIIFFK